MILLGKYRSVALAASLFVLFDLGVLVMNYYISFQLEKDALAVNLAGRQRMLSQRMTKALLQCDVQCFSNNSADAREVISSVKLFNETLTAFYEGGVTQDANNQPVLLEKVGNVKIHEQLRASKAVWEPLYMLLQTAIVGDKSALQEIRQELLEKNLILLRDMNAFTLALEKNATDKSQFMRQIQTIGILLAIINFIILVIHFIGKLREFDKRSEMIAAENKEILDTVQEGLFLLDGEQKLTHQHSAMLVKILNTNDIVGRGLLDILATMVKPQDLALTSEFIALLFSEHVHQELVESLNPLAEIEVISKQDNVPESRYLAFSFRRVMSDGKLSHILGTVRDITAQVQLRKKINEIQSSQQEQSQWLFNLVNQDPVQVRIILDSAVEALHDLNEQFAHGKGQDRYPLLRHAARVMHSLKGDFACYQFDHIAGIIQLAEENLVNLLEKNKIEGEDIIPLTLTMKNVLQEVNKINNFLDKIQVISRQSAALPELEVNQQQLQNLADQIALSADKKVEVKIQGEQLFAQLNAASAKDVQESLLQLVRNSVVHGIEKCIHREALGKDCVGRINLSLKVHGNELILSIRDDGYGIDINKIRETALRKNLISHDEAESYSSQQLINLIFVPGFSTAHTIDLHAGRGIGMDIIKEKVNKYHGRIRINTRKYSFTEFTLIFPANLCLKQKETDGALAYSG